MRIQLLAASAISTLYLLLFVVEGPNRAIAQDQAFELPVQLIGFPVIILSVRLSNFIKKLAYSLNPNTYRSRSRRDVAFGGDEISNSAIDATVAVKEIINEFGPKACIVEEPCRLHASRPGQLGAQPDWRDILRNYKVQSTGMKQWYLLSVFVGDVIRNVPLCKQLAKRLPCGPLERQLVLFTRD